MAFQGGLFGSRAHPSIHACTSWFNAATSQLRSKDMHASMQEGAGRIWRLGRAQCEAHRGSHGHLIGRGLSSAVSEGRVHDEHRVRLTKVRGKSSNQWPAVSACSHI